MLNNNPAVTIIMDDKIRRRWLAVLGDAQLKVSSSIKR
jgi:hypothetical protein|tara:strand:+ start:317 stop:430 length:114 start_codon:yes stop_codon:yes gene_type:complete